MIECIRDDAGNIRAVIEWLTFDSEGKMKNGGEILFIGELEIAPSFQGNGILMKFIRILVEKNPEFKKVFWFREKKYKGRGPRIYTRDQINRLIGG